MEQLKDKGIVGIEKISFKHDENVKILKGLCKNEQIRNQLIDSRFKISIGNTKKMVYFEPNLKPFVQCNNCVKYGHKTEQCKQIGVCANSNEATHKTELFKYN